MLYIDNPNNPLGRAFEPAQVEHLAAICDRTGTALLVDEAFGDYLDDAASAIHLVPRYRNLIVVRSFSKALGLAGERIGYMFLSAELARVYREIDVPVRAGDRGADARDRDPFRSGLDRTGPRRGEAGEETDRRGAVAHRRARPADASGRGDHGDPSARRRSLVRPSSEGHRRPAGVGLRAIRIPAWDDSFCRLRVMHGDQLDLLCAKLATL